MWSLNMLALRLKDLLEVSVTSACVVLCTEVLILLSHICCALYWIQQSFSQLGTRKAIGFKDILSKINRECASLAMWLFHLKGCPVECTTTAVKVGVCFQLPDCRTMVCSKHRSLICLFLTTPIAAYQEQQDHWFPQLGGVLVCHVS